MKPYTTAVIFAGGKSSRMGQDKALLPFGASPTLTQYQYQRLQRLFTNVYISTKKDKFDFDCHIIEDNYPQSSPLVGLLSLFESLPKEAVEEAVFVLSVDSPFVDEHIIHTLFSAQDKTSDITLAQSPQGTQPLCAIYKKSILPLLKTQYQNNNHKLKDLCQKANTQSIYFEDQKPFMNLNYKEEYEKALLRMEWCMTKP